MEKGKEFQKRISHIINNPLPYRNLSNNSNIILNQNHQGLPCRNNIINNINTNIIGLNSINYNKEKDDNTKMKNYIPNSNRGNHRKSHSINKIDKNINKITYTDHIIKQEINIQNSKSSSKSNSKSRSNSFVGKL
jgi:hypothetical protein